MQENNKKESGQNTVSYIFENIMSVFYLVMSFVLLFTVFFENTISKSIRLFLGILLGFYGIFRVYRAVKKFQNRNREGN